MKRIVLCADDYGQNIAISQAIIELFKKKRLSATSCLTTSPDWSSHAVFLRSISHPIDIGLHFNLTEGALLTGLPTFNLTTLWREAFFKQLNQTKIADELHAQLDAFIAAMGRPPNFMDGHQHVHQLPVVRDAFIEVYQSRFADNKTVYVRSVNQADALLQFKSPAYIKQMIIQCWGAKMFKKELLRHRIPHNTTFEGIYHFSHSKKYPQYFFRFLKQIGQNGLIMCHPGERQRRDNDSISLARYDEYQFFMSEQFTKLCKLNQIYITRFQWPS